VIKLKVLQTANLGKSLGGSSGSIRYSLYDTLGVRTVSTTNTGIYELGTNTGMFGVELNLSTQFSGSIVWSVDGNTNIYASEEVKIDQKITRHSQTGRWTIDATNKQMIFYQDDNETIVSRYNLFDQGGIPSVTEVFDRVYSGSS
jgi:hypothetical protein